MIWAGDEEKAKKAKNIILYILVGIVVMWLAFALVNWIVTAVSTTAQDDRRDARWTWSLIPQASARTYSESEIDTFREYQNKLRIAIQDLESELKVNKTVSASNIQNVKNLVQGAFDRLPDFGEAWTQNDTMKRAVDRDLDLAMKNPSSSSQVWNAISSVASFISSAKIESIQWSISATPGEWNAPITVSFQASWIRDPSGATPDQMSYIWWMRENGGVRKELWRWKSLIYTFSQEWTYTVFLDVISWSRNSKKRVDVLPLSTSKTIDVKPKLWEIILLINWVNTSNLSSLKINPNIWKMGIIFDATASRATGGNITETIWDFGNGNTMSYKWIPTVERQIYATEWNYTVKLTLKTNTWQQFTKELRLIVRNPSAVIRWDKMVGNIWDDMSFSALSYFTNTTNVEYSWKIQDDNNRAVVNNLAGNALRFKFDKVWNYIITLTARSPNGEIDTDSREIQIESRAPVINLDSPRALSTETPNTLVFDASKSYDPDTMSRKWLTYTWRIDGERIDLDNKNTDGSRWTYTFDTTWTRTVSLTVSNSFWKVTTIERQFDVRSILSVNMLITPRVAPLGTIVNFIAQSDNGDFFEWNMWDGSAIKSGNRKIMQHMYQKTGVYDVSVVASTARWGESNRIQRRVFVTDTNSPYAMIQISNGSNTAYYDPDACSWSGATVINRSETTNFDGSKSINIDGSNSDLTYTWNYFGKVKTTSSLSEKMNDIGCYPIRLTVRSNKNGASHTTTEYIHIKNLSPELTSVTTSIDTTKKDSQKVLVKVTANGVNDPDGVVTSYIWYYTTESDKEPQDIQITQRPEITFVLPNITEKYYFWVILEDNDGARTNSRENGSEAIPLILDNQNGNIYMPLINLTVPKNTVLVWENILFTAEAKTILGNNITRNAEYAWDFDGDGRFEERSSNPSINYAYKKPGVYQMRLRVTHNGVSNTRYWTVYVRNPLRADASIYRLPDGSLYLLNTSEGTYDGSSWKIWSDIYESPYNITLSPAIVTAIQDENLGSLRVSLEWKDASTFVLEKKNIIDINTQTWVIFQSSPRVVDDAITIKSQSDRLLLSLLWNTATTYAIDTDTRIDSNLDGIPDNDIDNQGHPSYNDGSLFIISDFGDTRVRERTIRLTLYSGTEIVDTRDIRIIFDFVPEDTNTDWSDSLIYGWSISDFERSKLEELSTIIRESDATDRIVLMREYNKMIENWGDTFSRAKSLIDIQELVNMSWLSQDKKDTMSRIIDELLVGNAQSIDEITIAAKVIQDLIPVESKNRTTIVEYLNTIISNPSDLENNKKLWKDILELVKTDPLIEDKYKIHIRNQLLIIINGGQSSIPEWEIKEESRWIFGTVMNLISWVVTIVLIVILFVLGILIVAYIFYRLYRKDADIGFQDFIIDSIWHTWTTGGTVTSTEKTNTTVLTQSTVATPSTEENNIIVKANIDPLASFTQKEENTENSPSTVENWVTPDNNQNTGEIPSWLQSNEKKTETAWEVKSDMYTPLDASDLDEKISSSSSSTDLSGVPSWLAVTQDTPSAEEATIDIKTKAETQSVTQDQDKSPVVPDWLTPGTDTDAGEWTITSPQSSDPLQVWVNDDSSVSQEDRGSNLPSWLIESLQEGTEQEGTEDAKNKIDTVTTTADTVSTNPPVKKESWWKKKKTKEEATEDIPDWLK